MTVQCRGGREARMSKMPQNFLPTKCGFFGGREDRDFTWLLYIISWFTEHLESYFS